MASACRRSWAFHLIYFWFMFFGLILRVLRDVYIHLLLASLSSHKLLDRRFVREEWNRVAARPQIMHILDVDRTGEVVGHRWRQGRGYSVECS